MRTQVFRFALFVWIFLCYSTLSWVCIAQNYQDYQTWHLPDGAISRLGTGGISLGDRVIAFSPDGTKLASGSLGGTVLVWNLEPANR